MRIQFKIISQLISGSFLAKIIGMLQKIPLHNLGGEGVFGIYHLIYPIYAVFLSLTTIGLPSVFLNRSTKRTFWMVSLSGLVGFSMFFFGAKCIAKLIGIEAIYPCFQCISFSCLLAPYLGMLRAKVTSTWFYSFSQVLEQIIRVSVMLFMLVTLKQMQATEIDVVAGTWIGSILGMLAGICLLLFIKDRRTLKKQASMWMILPSLFIPLVYCVDTFTLVSQLKEFGLNDTQIFFDIGLYSRSSTFLQWLVTLGGAFILWILPQFSETCLQKNQTLYYTCFKYGFYLAIASAVGFGVFAKSINLSFFKTNEAYVLFVLTSPLLFFGVLNICMMGLFQGIKYYRPLLIFFWTSLFLKWMLNLILVHRFGIYGAMWSSIGALSIFFIGNLFFSPFSLPIKKLSKKSFHLTMIMIFPLLGYAWLSETIIYRLHLELFRFCWVIQLILGIVLGLSVFYGFIKKEME